MSKFSAIYRWHHTRHLLKPSQNKGRAQIKFFLANIHQKTAIPRSLHQCWRKHLIELQCNMQMFVGTTILLSDLPTERRQQTRKTKKDGEMRSDGSSGLTWLNNHCLIKQDLTVPPITISQEVNRLVLTLHFLESIWNITKDWGLRSQIFWVELYITSE